MSSVWSLRQSIAQFCVVRRKLRLVVLRPTGRGAGLCAHLEQDLFEHLCTRLGKGMPSGTSSGGTLEFIACYDRRRFPALEAYGNWW